MAGRMTLSGRVVSSDSGGSGMASWWTLVGTNTGGRTVCVCVCVRVCVCVCACVHVCVVTYNNCGVPLILQQLPSNRSGMSTM